MIDDEDDAHRPLPVVLRPVEDELLSSWLARHAAYYGVTEPFFAKWLMLGTRNLSVLDHRLGLAQIARLSEKLRRDPIALIAMTFIDAPAGLDLFRRYLEIGSVVPSISPPWACPSPRAISSRPVSSRTSPRPRGLAAQGMTVAEMVGRFLRPPARHAVAESGRGLLRRAALSPGGQGHRLG